jgi:hypothetical protein
METPCPSTTRFADAARIMGTRLVRRAMWQDGGCTWQVPQRSIEDAARTAPADGSIYSGTAGIALFLDLLHRRTGDRRFARAAAGAVRHALDWAETLPEASFGFHAGRVGVAYAAARVGEGAEREHLAAEARRIVHGLRGREHLDTGLDVVAGAAGAIPALLQMSRVPGLEDAGGVAGALGEHLLRRGVRETVGWSWGIPRPSSVRPLCGLAHGSSGAGHALLELYAATGDDAYRYAGEQAFLYERQFYDAGEENWPDLRHPELSSYVFAADGMGPLRERVARGEGIAPYAPEFMCTWCHGAAGIALTRLRAYRLLGDARYLDEARAAVRTTAASLRDGDGRARWCLCHGVMGNADVLLQAAPVLNDPRLAEQAERLARMGWERHGRAGRRWPDELPGAGRDPTLMLGEAGIGWFYLRLDDPATPSMLLLAADAPFPAAAAPSHAAPETAGRAAELRSDYLHRFFGGTLRAFARLRQIDPRVPPVRLPPPGPHAAEPAVAAAAIQSAIDAAPGELRALLEDAAAVDGTHYALAQACTDHCDAFVDALRRDVQGGAPDWARPLVLHPYARLVATEHDWDAWLRSPAETLPAPGIAAFAVYRDGRGVARRRLEPLAARLLWALEDGVRADQAADGLGLTHVPPSELRGRVRAQLAEMFRAGLVAYAAPAAGLPAVPEPVRAGQYSIPPLHREIR